VSRRQLVVLIGLCVAVVLLGGAAVAVARHGRSSASTATPATATGSTAVPSDSPLVSLAPVPVGVTTTLPRPQTTTTAPAVTLLTTTTTAAPSDAPTTLPALSTTSPPVAGNTVTADGAFLQAPASTQVRPLGSNGDCQALVDKGFSGTCGVVGSLAYLVERSLATNGWRAYVFSVDTQKNTATVVLQSLDDAGADYTQVKVVAADVVGDGSRLIGFGFHLAGNTQTLAVDMVDGTGAVVMHRDLAHGSAWMSVGSFDDWVLGSGDAAGGYTHTVIHYTGGAWRVVQRGPASSAPASQL
jgi:hypothetical protein